MKKGIKLGIISAAIAAASISAVNAEEMEKCALAKDGQSLIKEGKAQCGTDLHSCDGLNTGSKRSAQDWIMVPEGKCKQIAIGNFAGVAKDVLNRVELDKIEKKESTE